MTPVKACAVMKVFLH